MFGSGFRFSVSDRQPENHRRKRTARANRGTSLDARRRYGRAYRPGHGGVAFEDLESRLLLSSDLTQQIDNLILGGTKSGTVTLPNVSVGSFLSIDSATVTFSSISQSGPNWSGTVLVSTPAAKLALGSGLTANIVGDASDPGLSGSYSLANAPLGQGNYSLSAFEIDIAAAKLLTGTAKGVTLAYSPGAPAGQKLTHVSSLTASLTPLHNASATLSNLDIYDNGFALEDGTINPGSIQLGGILSATSPSVAFSGLGYTVGSTPVGAIKLNVPQAQLFPNQSTFSATVDNLNGTYDFSSSTFSLTADDVMAGFGKVLQADATGLSLAYTASTDALAFSAATVDLTSPDFAGLDAKVKSFSADNTGLSIGDATLSTTPPSAAVTVGNVVQASGLSVSLGSFRYNTSPVGGALPFSGTLLVGASGAVSLLPSAKSFTANVTNFHGSFDLNSPVLALSADSADLKVGSLLDVNATNLGFSIQADSSVNVTVGAASISLPKFNVNGAISGLHINSSGFSVDDATVAGTGTVAFGSILSIANPSVEFTNVNYSVCSAPRGTIDVKLGSVDLFPGQAGKPFTANVTNFDGKYDLASAALSISADSAAIHVGSILDVSATGLAFTLVPNSGGGNDVAISVGSTTVDLPKFGVKGSVTNLNVTNDGFSVGTATVGVPTGMTKTITYGKFSIQNPSVTLTDFGYSVSKGANFGGTVSLGADEIDINASGSVGVAATGIHASISFQTGDLGHFTFSADTVHAHISSYLDLEADTISFDSAPGPGGNIVQFGNKVKATFALPGGASVTGQGQDFAIGATGNFIAGPTFGVSLSFANSDQLNWPSWLPLQLTYVGVSWNDFTNAPGNFSLTVSASVDFKVPSTSLHFGGFVQKAVLDVGKLENKQFPITSLGGFGVSVGGTVYGFQISGTLFGAILNVDSSFLPIADGDTTTPVAHSYLYGGIDAAFNVEGLSGFEIRIGISPYGPLDVYFQDTQSQILDPDTGLAITNFRGGIDVGTTLPSITNAKDLSTDAKFKTPAQQSLTDWRNALAGQVATVAKIYNNNSSLANTFGDLAKNITINGGATLFDQYAGSGSFTLDGDILLSFDGKIEVSGNLTFGSGFKVAGAAYLDLSQVAAGKAQVLMYIKAPADTPIVTAYGGIGLQFNGATLPPELGTGLSLNAPPAGSTTPGATDYVSAPNINLNNSSYTLEFWARRNDTGRLEEVIGQNDTTPGSDLQIGFDASNNFFVSSGGQTLNYANTDGNWHHWAVTFDNSTGMQTLYMDGQPVASGPGAPLQGTSTTLLIGKSGSTFFDGSVDEVRAWNVVRTAADIRKNYVTTTLTSTSGLLGDWSFGEGQGTTAGDSSGNGNAGTLQGNPTWALTYVNVPAAGSLTTFTMTVNGEVDLTLPGLPGGLSIAATSVFTINTATSALDMSVVGTVNLDPLGNLLQLAGKVHIDPPTFDTSGKVTFDGDAYAVFALTTGQLSELKQLGIDVSGTAILRFNSALQPVSVTLPTVVPTGSPAPGSGPNSPPATTQYYLPAQSVSMTINGNADFKKGGQDWFSIDGQFDAFFNFASGKSPVLELDADGSVLLGPSTAPLATFHVDGFLEISQAGLAAEFGISPTSSDALKKSGITLQYVQNGVTKDDSFTLLLNTTGQEVDYTIPSLDSPGIPVAGAGSQQLKIPAAPSGSSTPTNYLEIDGVGGLMLSDQISGSAQVNMTGSFQLLVVPGTFTFDVNMDFTLTVLGTPVDTFHAQGGLILQQGQGLAAALILEQKSNLPSSLGIGLNANDMLEVNTTGVAQSPGGISIPAGDYIRIHAHGDLTVQSIDVTGDFDLSGDSGGLTIAASGTTSLGLLGSANVDGVLTAQFGATPGVYGFLESTLATGSPPSSGFGLSSNMSFEMELNTLANDQPVSTVINGVARGFTVDPTTMVVTPAATIIIPHNTARVVAGGHVLIDGLFDLAGEFDFTLNSSDLQAHAVAQLQNFLGANLGLNATIDFFGNDALGQGGLAINAVLSLNSGSLGLGLVGITATPTLLVNTSNVTRDGVAPHTFEAALNNASLSVLGFAASGSLMVGVTNGQFEVDIPQSNPLTVSFFGLGGLSVYGFIEGNGQFSLSGSIGFDLGSGGNELYGSVNVTLSNTGFYGSFAGGASVFGINLASVSGSLIIESAHVHLGATVYVLGSGFSFDFDLGQLNAPKVKSTIYWYSVPGAANEGDTITLDAGAADSGGGAPADSAYSWAVYDNGQIFSRGTGAMYTAQLGDPGTYTVVLNVAGLSKVSTIQVANVAPKIKSVGNNLAYPFGVPITVTPSIIDPGPSDSSGGLTYSWNLTRNNGLFATAQGPTFTFTPYNPGTSGTSASPPDIYQLTLTVTDSSGAVSTASSTFAVFDPSNIVVNTTADYSAPTVVGGVTYTSLRFAMYEAGSIAGMNYVKFDPSLAGKTITLGTIGDSTDHGNSDLAVTHGYVFLDGSGAPGITISGQGAANPARLFYVANGAALDINDLNLSNGYATGAEGVAAGGAIYTDGYLNVFNSAIINNEAVGAPQVNPNQGQPDGLGGAVFIGPNGSLSASDDTFTGNVALGASGTPTYQYGGGGYGGAIYDLNTMILQSDTITGNFALAGSLPANGSVAQGGGVYDGVHTDSGAHYFNRSISSNIVSLNYGGSDYYIADPTYATGQGNLIGSIVNTPPALYYPFVASSANPRFGSPGPVDHGNGVLTLSLLPGSPAIGKGVTDSSTYDGRGYQRSVNGHLDIGAFETQPYLVTNTNDSGPGSLRAAISEDDNQSPVLFAPNLVGQKINLTSGAIPIRSNMSIVGGFGVPVTINGNGTGRIFTVSPGVTASVYGLNLANGLAAQGGAIYNSGNLTVQYVDFTGDVARTSLVGGAASAQGGAIYNATGANLNVTGTSFDNDNAFGLSATSGPNAQGGAVYNAPGAAFSASNDTFANNSARGANAYGTDGYSIVGDKASYPTYANVSYTGNGTYIWSTSTTDPRALQKSAPTATDRVAATLYSLAGSFTIDINLTDGQPHTVSLYALDYDGNNGRSQRIDVIDVASGKVLDNRTVSSFSSGEYLSWVLQGHVQFKLTALSGNALVNGLFFDRAPSGVTGPATFLGFDTTTQGNWRTTGAGLGGAIDNAGMAALDNVTVAYNAVAPGAGASPTTTTEGAGIENEAGATLTLYNTLVSANTGGHDVLNLGSVFGDANLVSTPLGLATSVLIPVNTSGNPALRPLAYNGGTTPTVGLQPGSSAIDTGDNVAANSPLAPLAGLLDWWRGDGNALDSTRGFNGSLVNGATYAPGFDGQAFSLNGQAEYVDLGSGPDIVGAGAFTVSAWIKTGSDGVIIQQRDANNFNGQYQLVVLGGKVAWYVYGNSQTGFNFTSNRTVSDNAWHLVSAVRNTDGSGQIYIDGALDSSQSGVAVPMAAGLNVYIGGDIRAGNDFFNGLIDDVALFGRALTATDVKTLLISSPTDQRNLNRIANGTVDVGAVEVQPYVVSNTNDSGYGSLRQAVADDASGDQPVIFSPALNGKTITLTTGPIAINHNLTITGPGAGLLTVSGGNTVEDFAITSGNVAISGLTIANGFSSQGGGISNAGALTVTNCVFTGDVASIIPGPNTGSNGQGGAIYNAPGGSLNVSGSTFSNNVSSSFTTVGLPLGRGGAIANAQGATLVATDDTFTANQVVSHRAYGSDGYNIIYDQAVYPSYASVSSSGSASYVWAGSTADPRALRKAETGSTDRIASTLYSLAGSFTIDVNLTDGQTHSVSLYALDFDGNNSRSERIDVINVATNAVLDSRTFSSFSGGQYLSWAVQGHVQFKVTALTGNAVIAGVFFDKAPAGTTGPVTFLGTDSTTQGNWLGASIGGSTGGAIDNAGVAAVISSTIAGNSVAAGPGGTSDGSGIDNETGASLTLFNTILANGSGGKDLVNQGTVTGDGNLVMTCSGLSAGVVATTADPRLGPLQNNGGPTPTMALAAGSPAIDVGDPALPSLPTTDQRGLPRVAGAGVDIGAYEYATPVVVTNTTSSGPGSLLAALTTVASFPGSPIGFAPSLAGQTITLGSELKLFSSITIDGSCAPGLVLRGNGLQASDGTSRIVYVAPGVNVTLRNLTISGGYADRGAGIYNDGNLQILDCTINGNYAYDSGGAIDNHGTLSVIDSTIANNTLGFGVSSNPLSPSVYQGAGIRNQGLLNLEGDTISGNSAAHIPGFKGSGGGLANLTGTAQFHNTIVAGNGATLGSGQDIDLIGGIINSLGHNLVWDVLGSVSFTATDKVGVDPLLGPLQNNGGPTATMAPRADSLAIDSGDPTGAPSTDQRGFSRLSNVTVDIGAYERQPFLVTSTADSGPGTLRQALTFDNDGSPIVFSPSLGGATISPVGEILIAKNVTIDGSAAPGPVVSGHGANRVFEIAAGATVTLANLSVENGNASTGGGILNGGTLTLSGVTVARNAATGNGGGIENVGYLKLLDSTVALNSASAATGKGGGIDSSGTMNVIWSTIAGNNASAGGGGYAESGIFTLRNSIFAGNTATTSPDVAGTVVSQGHNILGNASGAVGLYSTDLIGVDPLLGQLLNNGGPTPTMALLPGSPAIDAGDPIMAPQFDQRGLTRVVNGAIDIGAYELQIAPPQTDPGDPYVIHEGDSLTLNASDSLDPQGLPLTYSWDVNGDGTFGDAFGVNPTLTWPQLQALGVKGSSTPYMIRVQESDGYHTVTSNPVTLTVMPALHVTGFTIPQAANTSTPVDSAVITFSAPVFTTGIVPALSLTLNGNPAPIPPTVQVQPVSGVIGAYQISGLSTQTQANGLYVLTIDATKVSDSIGAGEGTATISWLMDTAAPDSNAVSPGTSTSTTFPVTAVGNDVSIAANVPNSALVACDLYVSTDGGPFKYWTTVHPWAPTALYPGQAGHTYSFYSQGHDKTGNFERKTSAESTTIVTSTAPPTSHITAVDTKTSTFHVSYTGQASLGNTMSHIDLFVQTDGGPARRLAEVKAAQGTVNFPAIVDGHSHTYRFYSEGVDQAGRVEPATLSSGRTVKAIFSPPLPQPAGLIVNHGAVGRSFIGEVDLLFPAGEDLSNLVAGGHIHLVKHGLDGKGTTQVPLTGVLHAVDHAIEFDFGATGLGGNSNSSAGDGVYEILVDGSPHSYYFNRLLGDVNGDGVVDVNDLKIVLQSVGMPSAPIGDANGDGRVTLADLRDVLQSQGHRLARHAQSIPTGRLPF